jgi:hypothetical protein
MVLAMNAELRFGSPGSVRDLCALHAGALALLAASSAFIAQKCRGTRHNCTYRDGPCYECGTPVHPVLGTCVRDLCALHAALGDGPLCRTVSKMPYSTRLFERDK